MKSYFQVLWAALLNRPIASRLVIRGGAIQIGVVPGSVVTGCRIEACAASGIMLSP